MYWVKFYRTQKLKKMLFFTTIPSYSVLLLVMPLFVCSSHEQVNSSITKKSIKHINHEEFSHQMRFDIALHGFLLWLSMGFLMPIGIFTIRMSIKEVSGRRVKVLFYLHVIFQMLSVIVATIGAVMSIRKFENSFNNNHQRVGLALYGAIWFQVLIGFLRPRRRNKRRRTWYFVHWILGTTISIIGILNIYTGIKAYHKKTSKGVGIWTLLFTAQVFFIAFLYLIQDKWEYIQKQGAISGTETITPTDDQVMSQIENQLVLVPQPCQKHNALKNLFD